MAHVMEAGIFRLKDQLTLFVALLLAASINYRHNQVGSNLGRPEATLHDIAVIFDLPSPVRENQTKLAFGTSKLPLFQYVQDLRPEGDSTVTRFRFRLSNRVVTVGPLPDMQFTALQIDV